MNSSDKLILYVIITLMATLVIMSIFAGIMSIFEKNDPHIIYLNNMPCVVQEDEIVSCDWSLYEENTDQ